MGQDKLRKFAEVAEFKNCVEPSREEAMTDGLSLKGNWQKEFFKNDNPIVLELACGGGEYSVALAEMYPNKNFIGIDIKGNRIWKGASKAIEKGITNVGFLRTRIDFLQNCFEENEVSEIWITFPDPQPQSNRRRKRLTHPIFLNKYQTILKPEGIVRLKTDSSLLYEFTNEVVTDFKLPVKDNTANVYEEFVINCDRKELVDELHIKTYYEKKWLEEGKKIKYISFSLPINSTFDQKKY